VRIHKLTQEVDFKNILEAKVDINLKIAKILSNALGWRINFGAFKGSKYSVAFPISDANMSPEEKEMRRK
jgi:hypothetical protein